MKFDKFMYLILHSVLGSNDFNAVFTLVMYYKSGSLDIFINKYCDLLLLFLCSLTYIYVTLSFILSDRLIIQHFSTWLLKLFLPDVLNVANGYKLVINFNSSMNYNLNETSVFLCLNFLLSLTRSFECLVESHFCYRYLSTMIWFNSCLFFMLLGISISHHFICAVSCFRTKKSYNVYYLN